MRKEVHLRGLWVNEIEEWVDREFEYTKLIRKGDLEGAENLLVQPYKVNRWLFGKFHVKTYPTVMTPMLENIPGITRP